VFTPQPSDEVLHHCSFLSNESETTEKGRRAESPRRTWPLLGDAPLGPACSVAHQLLDSPGLILWRCQPDELVSAGVTPFDLVDKTLEPDFMLANSRGGRVATPATHLAGSRHATPAMCRRENSSVMRHKSKGTELLDHRETCLA
jgi:hypothetical protein